MQRAQQSGNTRRTQTAEPTVRQAFACWSAALVALVLLNGCNLMRGKDSREPDPLCGEIHPKTFGNTPSPAAGKTTSTKSNTGAVPALPTTTATMAPAAIATGDPLLGSRPPLSIDGPVGGQPAVAWQPGNRLASQPKGDMNPNLRAPIVEALPAASAVPGGTSARPVSWTNSTAGPSYEQLEKQLEQRNVSSIRLEKTQGVYKLICTAPSPNDSSLMRTYVATATDRIEAMSAIIRQIDQERGLSKR